ncbi:ADP-ribosylglycohydrolase family protein [Tengunoibacter tsumagoiensis]|uniref:ADP-ribosylglycohydrolase n=1 Tax=Tengunoibacter tsumagoiensis TaxID=2014871 RepID=A0A402A444_9CHLR|nr:ADP-ribosylglycohydrolase family protein [Tengunoibacter tsumagoiensis]GCE13913.1 hypothetical protein KTT_37720 [Tengunoibacter tsumagoiensis]
MTVQLHDRFQGALLYSAVGDALGWPTESVYTYANRGLQPFYDQPATEFVAWDKYLQDVSGYREPVRTGEYSDDTQLALAVARSIRADGQFAAAAFAYAELPLWLQYVRGGGKRSKTAARLYLRKNVLWEHNFYKTPIVDYTQIQTNGPVVRNLSIALANAGDEEAIIKNSFVNAIVTHGHPRALLGTILYGLAINYTLTSEQNSSLKTKLIEYLLDWMPRCLPLLTSFDIAQDWIACWEEQSKSSFQDTLHKAQQEAGQYLERIASTSHYLAYYRFIGARYPLANWASGLSTVCAALYLFLHNLDEPVRSVVTAADTFGSDTDTIAACVGALQGAYHGLHAAELPENLLQTVQDREYILQMAERLYHIKQRCASTSFSSLEGDRETLARKILDWEEQYYLPLCHDQQLLPIIHHPILGEGTVLEQSEQHLSQAGLHIKLIRVQFAHGPSCLFRATRDNQGEIVESLRKELILEV